MQMKQRIIWEAGIEDELKSTLLFFRMITVYAELVNFNSSKSGPVLAWTSTGFRILTGYFAVQTNVHTAVDTSKMSKLNHLDVVLN